MALKIYECTTMYIEWYNVLHTQRQLYVELIAWADIQKFFWCFQNLPEKNCISFAFLTKICLLEKKMRSNVICFFLSKVVASGLLSLANLSKLFYLILYRSLEGTVGFRPLWPLPVLEKVLNSRTMSERWKERLFKGGKKPFLGSTQF